KNSPNSIREPHIAFDLDGGWTYDIRRCRTVIPFLYARRTVIGDEMSNVSNNAVPGRFSLWPLRHRLAIARRYQEIAQQPAFLVDRNVAPSARLKDDSNRLASPNFGSGECALHFLFGAVVRIDEVGAD